MRIEISQERGTGKGSFRATARIVAKDGVRNIWFELPDDLEGDLTTSGAPWALLMLPHAVRTGEPIELSLDRDGLESGIAVASTTILRGKPGIRAAIVNHRTQPRDVDALIDATIAFGEAASAKRRVSL